MGSRKVGAGGGVCLNRGKGVGGGCMLDAVLSMVYYYVLGKMNAAVMVKWTRL